MPANLNLIEMKDNLNMQERSISVETALLAKKKGMFNRAFDQYVQWEDGWEEMAADVVDFFQEKQGFSDDMLATAFPHEVVQRELREVHKIFVFVFGITSADSSRDGYYYHIGLTQPWGEAMYKGHSFTYEDAFDKGLQDALKRI